MGYIHRSSLEVKQWCLRRECSTLQKARRHSTDCTRLERGKQLKQVASGKKAENTYQGTERVRISYQTMTNLSYRWKSFGPGHNQSATNKSITHRLCAHIRLAWQGPQKCKIIARVKMDCTKPWKSFRDLEFALKRRKRSSLVTCRDQKNKSNKDDTFNTGRFS